MIWSIDTDDFHGFCSNGKKKFGIIATIAETLFGKAFEKYVVLVFVYLLHVFILSVEFVVCLFPNKGTLHQKMIVAWLLKLNLAAL